MAVFGENVMHKKKDGLEGTDWKSFATLLLEVRPSFLAPVQLTHTDVTLIPDRPCNSV
jgi:hypothetical protein